MSLSVTVEISQLLVLRFTVFLGISSPESSNSIVLFRALLREDPLQDAFSVHVLACVPNTPSKGTRLRGSLFLRLLDPVLGS